MTRFKQTRRFYSKSSSSRYSIMPRPSVLPILHSPSNSPPIVLTLMLPSSPLSSSSSSSPSSTPIFAPSTPLTPEFEPLTPEFRDANPDIEQTFYSDECESQVRITNLD